MLLVAPDPRLGISPERISRVRTLLDGLPTAPGVAVALPGGPDGELDALVLRPDGVLGLVPAPSSRRDPVGVGVTTAGADGGAGAGPQELAAAEIDRLLALAEPTPTAPRQVVPIVDRHAPATSRHEDPERTDEDTGVGVATAARLVLTASAGPSVLDAGEVRRLFAAWRLAEFVPDAADLHTAGFPGELADGGRDRSGVVGSGSSSGAGSSGSSSSGPRSVPPGIAPASSAPAGFASFGSPTSGPSGAPTSSGPGRSAPGPSAGPTSSGSNPAVGGAGPTSSGPGVSGSAVPAVVPAARSAGASSPGGAPAGPPRTGVLPVGPDGFPEDEAAPRPSTSPIPAADDRATHASAGAPATSGTWATPGPWPAVDAGSRPRRRRGRPTRRPALTTWLSTWRGLAVAAVVTFAVALGVAVLVVRGVSPAPEDVAAQPVRVVDGVSWTQRVVATEPTCEGHAYGLAVQFLRERPCTQLDRSLWSGDVGGTPMVASVALVRMHDVASATAFKALVDSSGTGNVADLLREGRGFPGAPASLGNAGYGSALLGDSVVITETASAGSGSVGESTLDKVAKQALGLG
ncbi:hypothetical protein LQ327_27855 [Actinomycetospora endophytica]|uniref:Uncharacterized protein n=1 Tax=Actinomycetospora endophytica TaxID=2291215 RepID=A0ABS8PFY1_9PSEU|nr:hypothetical protein [Actinomycetospora endophytica]MCD2197192.1 hypothetical protein [Actinomycetospora endophytica]